MKVEPFDRSACDGATLYEAGASRRSSSIEPARTTATRRLDNARLLQMGTLVFLLPNAILAWGFGISAAGAVWSGCMVAAVLLCRFEPKRQGLLAAPVDMAALAGCMLLVFFLFILAGETHLFFANSDWLIRDAVLSDLARQGFPLFYRYEAQDYLLRAPLGMYLLPATVGHFAGSKAAHVVLLAQNAGLLALCLYFVA